MEDTARCVHCGKTITREDAADAWRAYATDSYACAGSAGGHETAPCRACGGVEYGPCPTCPPSLPGKPAGLDSELRRFLP